MPAEEGLLFQHDLISKNVEIRHSFEEPSALFLGKADSNRNPVAVHVKIQMFARKYFLPSNALRLYQKQLIVF